MTLINSLIGICFYVWMSHAQAVVKFPTIPDCFKSRISGQINNKLSQTFFIEQYYCLIGDDAVGKTVFSSGDKISGLIYDEIKNHSIRYNFTSCSLDKLSSPYQPFDFYVNANNESRVSPGLIDAFYAFQNNSLITSVESTFEDGVHKTVFVHDADTEASYPYAISVTVDNALRQIDRVIISATSENKSSDWLVMLRYGDVIKMTDPSTITIPPHDVFCKSDQQVKTPKLGKFYYMEIRILSEYYKKQESLSLVKISEYVYDGVISVGYHASTDQHIHYTNIVHDYNTGAGAIINRNMELCHRYQIKAPNNATLPDKKELFKSEILNEMHLFEKQYFVLFWQVLELLKNGSVAWQYQGSRVIDSTQCNVWSYPIRGSWIAEVAFSVEEVRLRESSFSNKLQSILVSIELYRYEAPADSDPAISFRVSDYQIDSNPVSTELLFDTSVCFEDEDSCVVQFKLDISYQTLHRIGLGNVKRAITRSIASKTLIKPQQTHHVTLSAVPNGQSLVTLTVYHGFGNDIIAIQLFKDRIRAAIDNKLYVSFTNENSNEIQVAYSVEDSLVFDYQIVNSQHWSVSVAATISLCIGTMFIGVIIGALSINCWKRKKKTAAEGGSPYYRRFKDEEIEEVEFGDNTDL